MVASAFDFWGFDSMIAAKRSARCTSRQEAADALVIAAHVDQAMACRFLLSNPSLVERRASWGESAVEAASHLGSKRLMWRCIEAGAAIDLFTACALGDRRLALNRFKSATVDARGVHGLPLLHFAIVGGNLELLGLLLERGAAVNPYGAPVSPLHTAVAMKPLSVVRMLLEAGADANAPDSMGASPLDWGIDLHGAGAEVTELLVRSGGVFAP